jgi:hypothetical protein
MHEERMVAELESEILYQKPRRRWITNIGTYLRDGTEGERGLDYFLRLFEGNLLHFALLLVLDITT